MSIKPNLTTSLRQNLVLTPQMRQRIELLSMTKLELNEMVTQELIENPLLELDEPTTVESSSESVENLSESEDSVTYDRTSTLETRTTETLPNQQQSFETSSTSNDDSESEPEINPDAFQEIDFGTTFEEYLDPGYKTTEYEYDDRERPSYENFLSRPLTLSEHLLWQLRLSDLYGELRDAAEAIIGNLNDDGYLDATIQEIAEMGGWTEYTVEEARFAVQSFDPVGVASLNKRECLLVQLEQMGLTDRLAYRLISNYLDRLQQFRLPEIAKELNVTLDEIRQEMDVIKKLEPYPGRKYTNQSTHYIEPEVYIEKIDEEYYIHFNDEGMPQLRINSHYRRLLESNDTTKETRDYIKNRFRSAVDLLKNIEHRRQTIYRVCESIVRRQREFLDKGVEYIRPMMLKDVAEDIEMHLSTVSRVVNGKYAHTPQGVIELRRFFTEGMVNEDGEEVSTRVIKLQIKKMIEEEDSRNPLTDDEIAKRLAKDGMKMSRRTVAKYRDQMNIPGSRERRSVI
ncbi:MAG: RNA polymerase factor sigma-54 [Blastocatellia bacterium]|nr:RNA polymerase factor sigma-54 [Blastocatellia bacterium]